MAASTASRRTDPRSTKGAGPLATPARPTNPGGRPGGPRAAAFFAAWRRERTRHARRRLVPGFEAPVNLVYSQRNRSACTRIPVTGANDPTRAPVIATLPIWAFHGAKDSVAPVENTREMVTHLRTLGSPVKYTEYPDVGHESWHRAYAEPEVFPWLLAQRRRAP